MGAMALGVFALALAICSKDAAGAPTCDDDGPRIDCGDLGTSQEACEAQGCCWRPITKKQGRAQMDMPWCFYSNADPAGYTVDDITTKGGRVDGGRLKLARSSFPEAGRSDLASLKLEVLYPGHDSVRVRLTDADRERWEVPQELYPGLAIEQPGPVGEGQGQGQQDGPLEFKYESSPYFSFAVSMRRDGTAAAATSPSRDLFNTSAHRLIFKDQYIELTTSLPPGSRVFGLGERTPSSGLEVQATGLPRTLWARDWGAAYPDINLYGTHPTALVLLPDGTAHGLLLLSSNAMDVVLAEGNGGNGGGSGGDGSSGLRLSFRLTGGIIDLLVVYGPSPMGVTDTLTRLTGRPAPQPYWALGFHQCRWGYKNVGDLRKVVRKYEEARLPLEVMWSDIDAMDGKRVFTLDPVNYPVEQMRKFVAELHSKGQRWVPIVDPGVKIDPGYPVYDDGLRDDVFLKDVTGKPYVGFVWPGAVHYPDFQSERAVEYWGRQIAAYHKLVEFDGLWIDMNEASNFCTGEVCRLPNGDDDNSVLAAERPHTYDASNDCPLRCALRPQLQAFAQAAAAAVTTPGSGSSSSSGRSGGDRGVISIADLISDADLEALPEARAVAVALGGGSSTMTSADLRSLLANLTLPGAGLWDPPYQVANSNVRAPLGTNAIGMTVRGTARGGSSGGGGGGPPAAVQYNSHSLYGLVEAAATHAALLNVTGRRPFILTRSSFPGSGSYAAHWTGDNQVSWDDLYWSVLGVINSGLFGMPLAGADICGFSGTPNRELCARWISLGAFYPFSRNHHSIGVGSQELYRWEEVAASGRRALSLRYALLATLYTHMRAASSRGCPMFRPLWMNYPRDNNTHTVDRQFMLGDSILVTPVLEQGVSSVRGYFPPGKWYSLWDESPVDSPRNGSWKTLTAPLGDIPVHVAGGHVLAMQSPKATTSEVRASPMLLVVALPAAADVDAGGGSGSADRDGGGAEGSAAGERCMSHELPPRCSMSGLGLRSGGFGAGGGERGGGDGAQRLVWAKGPALLACGQVYMDQGHEPELLSNPGSLLTVSAELATSPDGTHQSGTVLALFGPHGRYATADDGSCGGDAGALRWPRLHAISVLGVPPGVVLNATIERVVVLPPGAASPASACEHSSGVSVDKDCITGSGTEGGGGEGGSSKGGGGGGGGIGGGGMRLQVRALESVPSARAVYDPHRLELRFPKLNAPLACPEGVRLTWTSLLQQHTAPASSSLAAALPAAGVETGVGGGAAEQEDLAEQAVASS